MVWIEDRLSNNSSSNEGNEEDEDDDDDDSNDESLAFFDSVEGPSNPTLIDDPVNQPGALFSPTNSNYFPQNTPTTSALKPLDNPISPTDFNYFQSESPLFPPGEQPRASKVRMDSRDIKATRSSSSSSSGPTRIDRNMSFSERLGQVGWLATPLATLQDKDNTSLCCFHFDNESFVCAAIEMDDLRSNRAG